MFLHLFDSFYAILCGSQGVLVAKKYQMSSDVNISSLFYHK